MSDRPLSVLMVSTTLNTGGAQRFTSTLLTHLDRERFAPSLALLRPDIGYPLPDDVEVHTLGYRGCWDFIRTAGRLRRVIEQTRPDVVLSNITATNLVTGSALRWSRHQPRWIARIGTNPARHDNIVRRLVARRAYRRVNQFVVNSRGLGGELTSIYGIEPHKIAVIGNPTDFRRLDNLAAKVPELTWSGDGPLLIAVGRLFPEKRYDIMLAAYAMVQHRTSAHLWICGDGPCRGIIERQIRELRLQDHVELLGHCENPYALMRQADLFVMSSDHEGLPNALIEAQGLGLPAVSADCPCGPDEIIERHVTGLLTPVGDPQTLATAMSRLLDDKMLRQNMSSAARETARRQFDVPHVIAQWTRFLCETDADVPKLTDTDQHTAQLTRI